MPGRGAMSGEQKRKKRERERERERLLDTKSLSYFKWMHISKTWFTRFFLCLGMKLELSF